MIHKSLHRKIEIKSILEFLLNERFPRIQHFHMQTELFEQSQTDPNINLLSRDGIAHYLPNIFDTVTSDLLHQSLLSSLDWQPDQLWMFGKKVTTQRKVAWVGDDELT